jgi:hypothetical protein
LEPVHVQHIVVPTSWVDAPGFEKACDSLPLAPRRACVAGATFNHEEESVAKWRGTAQGQQVRRHVKKYGINKWLALDEGFVCIAHCAQKPRCSSRQQYRRVDLKRACNLLQVIESDISHCAFDLAYVRAVKSTVLTQTFLREFPFYSQSTDVVGQPAAEPRVERFVIHCVHSRKSVGTPLVRLPRKHLLCILLPYMHLQSMWRDASKW